MSSNLICPRGHHWPSPADGPDGPCVRCPVCGIALEAEAPTLSGQEPPFVDDSDHYPSFPGYRVLGELGRGGMGVVYRAHDPTRQTLVALKTMQWVEPVALYRFKQEFRALAGLAHPNLVTLHELVAHGREWFFTMELIEGASFLAHVRPGRTGPRGPTNQVPPPTATGPAGGEWVPPRPPPSALNPEQMDRLRSASCQLASGLLALHDAGKLHRDVKPGNVLVTGSGRVVLLDFGLAADLDPSGRHQNTEPNLLGTADYMAPEQAASKPVTPASDWYAVGVMLYEALTGRLPFEGPVVEVLQAKQRADPPGPRSLLPEIPEDLDALTVELLRRDPEVRPPGHEILRRLAAAGGVGRAPPAPSRLAAPAGVSLVGRKRHLEVLAGAFQSARQGNTALVHVIGPPGVGKSALVRHFLETLTDAVVLAGRCYEQEAVPYKALDSLVDALSRYLVRLPAAEVEAVLPRDVLALARVFPVLRRVGAVTLAPRRPLDLTDPQEVRRRALAALRELLGRLGDRRPLVLFIDDLQWGDIDSTALLADLLRPADAPAMLLIVSYRGEDAARPWLRALPGADEGGRELAVEPLTDEESRELAVALLADVGSPLAAETAARESGGNPYFLRELVQHAAERPAGGAVALPDVLWARALRLPEEARRLLEVVAVAGRPLRPAEACQAAGVGETELTALAQLRSGRFVRTAGTNEDSSVEAYHDRIRETVVARLSPAALQEHHRGLALVLESSRQSDPELLAVHFQGAGDSGRAGKYFALAAARAAETLAFDRAAKLYRLALDLHGEAGPEGHALRVRFGDALANAGRGAEAAREYLAAAAGGSPDESLELRRRAALQFLISGHVDEGLAALRAVLDAAGMAMPATGRRAFWSLVLRRVQLWWRGLTPREPPEGTDRRSVLPLTSIAVCWTASAGLSMVDPILGAYFHTRGLLLALDAGAPSHLTRALAMEAGHVAIGGGRTQKRTARILEAADTLARQVDQPYARGVVALAGGIAAALQGRWRRALTLCDEAEGIFRGSCTGAVWELDTAHRFASWALMFMGEVAELARRLPVLRKEAEERGDLYGATNLTLVAGTLASLAADEPDRAREEVERVMARWSRQGFHVQHLDRLRAEVWLALYAGDGRQAWERLNAHWPVVAGSHLFRVQQNRIFMHHLRAVSALAAAEKGDPRPLLRAAERDARLLERERVAWADALAGLVRACVAWARGDAGKAAGLLRNAAADLDAAEMRLHAAAARRHLGPVVGGDEGRAAVTQADEWMRGQGIRDPARLAAVLAPGG